MNAMMGAEPSNGDCCSALKALATMLAMRSIAAQAGMPSGPPCCHMMAQVQRWKPQQVHVLGGNASRCHGRVTEARYMTPDSVHDIRLRVLVVIVVALLVEVGCRDHLVLMLPSACLTSITHNKLRAFQNLPRVGDRFGVWTATPWRTG